MPVRPCRRQYWGPQRKRQAPQDGCDGCPQVCCPPPKGGFGLHPPSFGSIRPCGCPLARPPCGVPGRRRQPQHTPEGLLPAPQGGLWAPSPVLWLHPPLWVSRGPTTLWCPWPKTTATTHTRRFAARPPRGALGSIPRPLAPSAPVGVPWPDHPVVSLAEDDSHNTHPKGKPTSSATPNKKESWRTIAFTALTADWVNVLRHD